MDPEHLIKFVCLYLLFEDALFEFAGKGRKHNNFCMPVKGTNVLPLLTQVVPTLIKEDGIKFSNLMREYSKYCALNLSSLYKFGSVEFRHHEGSYDTDKISQWICLILSIKNFAETTPFPLESIPDMFSASGPIQVAEEVFGEYVRLLIVTGKQIH